jgi:hypothetical protein
MCADEEPLDVRCRVKEPCLPFVSELSGVNENLRIAKTGGAAPWQKSISGDVAGDYQRRYSDSEPSLHRPNEKKISYGHWD